MFKRIETVVVTKKRHRVILWVWQWFRSRRKIGDLNLL